jgi:hypothetical protein
MIFIRKTKKLNLVDKLNRQLITMKHFIFLLSFIISSSLSFSQIDTTTYRSLSDSVFVVGDRILVRDVRFDLTGGGRIQHYSHPILDSVSAFLAKNPNLIVEVAQFTDFRGTAQSNNELSQRRAQGVYDFLVHRCGVNPQQLIPKGYGSSEPIIPDEVIKAETERHEIERLHQINRRMELRVVGFLDDCSDFISFKRTCVLLNWPLDSRNSFSKGQDVDILLSCACELIDFQITVFTRYGEVVHQQILKRQKVQEGDSMIFMVFTLPLTALPVGTYVYMISRNGSAEEENALVKGHFSVYD